MNGDSVPAKCSSIVIGQSVLSLVKCLDSAVFVYSGSVGVESFVDVNLHVGFHVLNDREEPSMARHASE